MRVIREVAKPCSRCGSSRCWLFEVVDDQGQLTVMSRDKLTEMGVDPNAELDGPMGGGSDSAPGGGGARVRDGEPVQGRGGRRQADEDREGQTSLF